MAQLDGEEKQLAAVEEAIVREFLPKSIAERIIEARSSLGSLDNTLGIIPPKKYPSMTVCAVRILNFYSTTKNLPPDEVEYFFNNGTQYSCI